MFTLSPTTAPAQAEPRAVLSPTLVVALIGVAVLVVVGAALLNALAALAEIATIAVVGIFSSIRALLMVAVGIVLLVLVALNSGDRQPRDVVVAPGEPPASTVVSVDPPVRAFPSEPPPEGGN